MTADGAHENRLFGRVTRRLVPFLFVCYVCAYLDRVNVGFAKLQMAEDLGLSDAVYGFGAGVFFLGYFLFEVPSNLLLRRFGARIWIARIMIVWGVVSAAMMFVKGRTSFYTLRFALGVAEAGFFPGVIYYLTRWFPRERRARTVALFMTAVAASGVVGGPLSGAILAGLDAVAGLRGWQWLFLLEAAPSIVLGLAALAYLDDGPEDARWLSRDERARIVQRLRLDPARHATVASTTAEAFRRPLVWAFCATYFGIVMGLYGVSFWLPQIVRDLGVADPRRVGLLTAVPWAAAAMSMVLVGRRSDRTGERRWHVAVSALAGAVGFAVSGAFLDSPIVAMAGLTLATAGVLSATATFWAVPTAVLSGAGAAAGIAWINSIGNLAGQLSPTLVGVLRARFDDTATGLYGLGLSLLVAGIVVAVTAPRASRG